MKFKHFNSTGNALLDSVANDPVADISEACGAINSQAGIFAPVTTLLTKLFAKERFSNYPHLFRPHQAEPYNWANSIVLPAASTTPVATPVLTFKVPTGYNGVILHLVNMITTGYLEGSGELVWSLLEGVRPVKNFGRIVTTQGSLQTPWPVYGVRIRADQTYTFTVQNYGVIGGGIQAIAVVGGYYWPQGRER